MQILFKQDGKPQIVRFVKTFYFLEGGLLLTLSNGNEQYYNPDTTDVRCEPDSRCPVCGHVWGCYEDYRECQPDPNGVVQKHRKPAV